MIRRFVAAMGSTLTLMGAIVIGGVLHQTMVKGTYPITSPVAVFGFVAGVALVAAGIRLESRFDPSEYVPDENEEDEEEFDEELSPISEEMLEDREADDAKR